MNNYYFNSSSQNFLGCTPPDSTTITLTGFATNTPLFITWFPTRLNSTLHPPQDTLVTTTGALTLDLSGYLGGTANNYLDTLRSDYAFIITPGYFEKSAPLGSAVEAGPVAHGWDFGLYPNPAQDVVYMSFTNDLPKDFEVLDMMGRPVATQNNITATIHSFPIGQLPKGIYGVRVTEGDVCKTKKLIIH